MTAESGNSARIDGQAAALPEAMGRAAELLASSRQPLVTGLSTDVAGARAALALAAVTGSVIDHAGGEATMCLARPLQDGGGFVVTPGEMRARADSVLVIGPSALHLMPGMAEALAAAPPLALVAGPRRVLQINAGAGPLAGAELAEFPGLSPLALVSLMGARARGHHVNVAATTLTETDRVVAWLAAAHYGVIIFNPLELGAPGVEALFRLATQLNRATRFSTLPLVLSASAETFKTVCLWTTGFPGRVNFATGAPAYDPELFDPKRMVASGEADLVLGIDSFGEGLGVPDHTMAQILLAPSLSGAAKPPDVFIPIGEPGRDHAGVMFDPAIGTLRAMPALAPSPRPSAAAMLETLRALALRKGGAPC
ncbi:MAG: hypothetical protein KGQ37_10830 [Hyphomicrobiales bacterium]|nr:hypothetical protein [Hyphomicrobiales bacterium]